MISVIVVTYNQQDTIARTLDSILAQRIDVPFEIVIGDDCSSDATEAICRRYAARFPDKIVYLRRPANMGVTANYFDCIARARGQYLADCAGDDFWTDPDKLRAQLDVLETEPDVSLVATDWLCRDSISGALSRHPGNPEPEGIERFPRGSLAIPILTGARTIHLCSALYRKDIIDKAVAECPEAFVDPKFSCEDQQILLCMATRGDIVVLPRVSLHYSVGHSSISHPDDYARMFDYSMRALRQALILKRYFDLDSDDIDAFTRRRINHLAAMALRAGSPERRNSLRRFIRRKRISPLLKARLYLSIMKFPPMWRAIRRLRK